MRYGYLILLLVLFIEGCAAGCINYQVSELTMENMKITQILCIDQERQEFEHYKGKIKPKGSDMGARVHP